MKLLRRVIQTHPNVHYYCYYRGDHNDKLRSVRFIFSYVFLRVDVVVRITRRSRRPRKRRAEIRARSCRKTDGPRPNSKRSSSITMRVIRHRVSYASPYAYPCTRPGIKSYVMIVTRDGLPFPGTPINVRCNCGVSIRYIIVTVLGNTLYAVILCYVHAKKFTTVRARAHGPPGLINSGRTA